VYTGNYRNNKFHGVVWSCLAKVFSVLTSRWPWRIESRCSIHVSSFVIVYCCRPPGGRLPVAWRSRIPGHVRSTACRSILALLTFTYFDPLRKLSHQGGKMVTCTATGCICTFLLVLTRSGTKISKCPIASHHRGRTLLLHQPVASSTPFQRHPKAVERC
jgi:hypothetical protein